jgi:hypothetical protein
VTAPVAILIAPAPLAKTPAPFVAVTAPRRVVWPMLIAPEPSLVT